MSWVGVAAAGAAAVPGIVKMVSGGKQVKDAEELAAKNKFTSYQTPAEVLQATKLAQNNYLNGMPGQDLALNNIGTNAAGAYNTATQGASSSGDLIDAATRINVGANAATNNLTGEAANYKANALQGYEAALGNQAGYKDKEYQINYLDPFIRKANTAASMYGAGKMNQSSGLDSVATAALSAGYYATQGSKQPTMGQALGNPYAPQAGSAGITQQQGFSSTLPNWQNRQLMPQIPQAQQQGLNTSSIVSALYNKNGK